MKLLAPCPTSFGFSVALLIDLLPNTTEETSIPYSVIWEKKDSYFSWGYLRESECNKLDWNTNLARWFLSSEPLTAKYHFCFIFKNIFRYHNTLQFQIFPLVIGKCFYLFIFRCYFFSSWANAMRQAHSSNRPIETAGVPCLYLLYEQVWY